MLSSLQLQKLSSLVYTHTFMKPQSVKNKRKNYSTIPFHTVSEYSALLVFPPITRILSATPTTAEVLLAAGIFVKCFH